MTTDIVVDIAREALWLIIKCSAPMLLVSLVVGLLVSIFQTVTSIQEQTLTFVPKMLGIFLTLMICGGWILNNIVDFVVTLFGMFGTYVNM
ncbi:MAG: flagellar biosynthesis protein FliQ [Lachnospiraceae bacterium]|nr:flagellar biosynthesis protein FliQ [Lachnospiraceae bacterium]MBP3507213.1 flagellar biosynthesis protein FliQ [Lachnospiraceae bacterium]